MYAGEEEEEDEEEEVRPKKGKSIRLPEDDLESQRYLLPFPRLLTSP
jgi:hypothetical protein